MTSVHPTRRAANEKLIFSEHRIHPALPTELPKVHFAGRKTELAFVRTAMGLDERWRVRPFAGVYRGKCPRLCLEAPAGTGKRALVTEIARHLDLPLYEMQGHAGMSPEDMVLAVVPRETDSTAHARLSLQASPLSTALLLGGIVYFDAISRASEQALAPLTSLLDGRMLLYSGITGLQLAPLDPTAPFYFICSWDPMQTRGLPGFLSQRTLPRLRLKPLKLKHTRKLVGPLAEYDRDQLTSAALKRKQDFEDSALAQEVRALELTVKFLRVQAISERIDGGEPEQALRALMQVTALLPTQRAVIQAREDVLVSGVRRLASDLAGRNEVASAARATKLYGFLFEIGRAQHYDRNNFAHSLMHEGRLDEALIEVDKALEEYRPAIAWITRGEVLEAMGSREAAIDSFEKAYESDPDPHVGGHQSKTTRDVAREHLIRLGAWRKSKEKLNGKRRNR